jgi:hypothetical protein
MSDRVLIVRTVNMEELGPLIDSCRAKWPAARFSVLTSPNRSTELSSDPRIDEVIAYPMTTAGFGAPWNDGRPYRALVVPVRNSAGWGYGNVWEAVSGVAAESFWIAAWGQKLLPVKMRKMIFRTRAERFLRFACAAAAWPLAVLFLLRVRRGRKGAA